MTEPRQLLPGRTYLVTRRCTQRQYLLKPSRITNEIVRYCLALAAKRTGVLIHAVCFMSNHWHGVVSDPFACLPEFLENFHRLLARAQNAALGRWENLWSSDKTSVVLLVSAWDILEKMAYTLANPTAAGLVHSPDEWPGTITKRIGELWRTTMPDVFFDSTGSLPSEVSLTFQRPPGFDAFNDLELALELDRSLRSKVRAAREELTRKGHDFLGIKAVLRQSFSDSPSTPAPRRNHKPRVAAGSDSERRSATKRIKVFLREYRDALTNWRAGNRSAVFPAGTYALRIYARVACAPAVPI